MGHDGLLQAIYQYKFIPWDFLTDFPQAIHQVMLTVYLSEEQPLINVAMDVVCLGIVSAELQWLLSIM